MNSHPPAAMLGTRQLLALLAIVLELGCSGWRTSRLGPLRTRPDCASAGEMTIRTAEDIILNLGLGLEMCPQPVILVVDPNVRDYDRPGTVSHLAWRADYARFRWKIPHVTVKRHDAYTEILWGKIPPVKRRSVGTVPPMAIAADCPLDLAVICSEVLGIPFEVDMTRRSQVDKGSWCVLREESLPLDGPLDNVPTKAYGLGILPQNRPSTLMVTKPTPTADFVALLASRLACYAEWTDRGWRLRPPANAAELAVVVEALVGRFADTWAESSGRLDTAAALRLLRPGSTPLVRQYLNRAVTEDAELAGNLVWYLADLKDDGTKECFVDLLRRFEAEEAVRKNVSQDTLALLCLYVRKNCCVEALPYLVKISRDSSYDMWLQVRREAAASAAALCLASDRPVLYADETERGGHKKPDGVERPSVSSEKEILEGKDD